jgi:ATPase subunit of ABC transporter with duplicated ATPase domains
MEDELSRVPAGVEDFEEIQDIADGEIVEMAPRAGVVSQRPEPMAPDEALIVCDNLVKIYKVANLEVVALQGLDLLVDRGEFVALVGASGSGKSTLLNILSGLDVPSAGRAVVAGHVLGEMDARERTEYRRRGDRLRVAAVGAQPAAVPVGPRERGAADDARRAEAVGANEARHRAARAGGAGRARPPPPAAAIGRRAATCLHRGRHGQPPAGAVRR